MIHRKFRMERNVRGMITVEMTYILPIIFLIFIMVIYTVFYYHDKNILIGAAGETAIAAAQTARRPEKTDPSDFVNVYRERIHGKLILFSGVEVSVEEDGKQIHVNVCAKRKKMRLQITQSAAIVEPEKKIRRKRSLEKLKDSIGREKAEE